MGTDDLVTSSTIGAAASDACCTMPSDVLCAIQSDGKVVREDLETAADAAATKKAEQFDETVSSSGYHEKVTDETTCIMATPCQGPCQSKCCDDPETAIDIVDQMLPVINRLKRSTAIVS